MRKVCLLRVFCIVCFWFGLLGCPQQHKKPTYFDENADGILNNLRACQSKMTALSGVLQTTTWREGERVRLEQLFLRSSEGNLRIDTLSPMGQPLSTVVFDGGKITVYDQNSRQFFVGSADREVVKQFLFIDLPPDDLSTLLGGCSPFTRGVATPLTWEETTGRIRFELSKEEETHTVWIENQTDVRKVEFRNQEAVSTLFMGAYATKAGHKRPMRFKFEDTNQNLEIEIKISELNILETIGGSPFTLTPPPGVEAQPL